jgi:predicted transcriptional regulator
MVGERNHRSKLTADDVSLIRSSDMSGKALAKMLGVAQSTVSEARTGKKWAAQLAA